ncbi:MAG TPA: MFS transporter [Steroidobacteraceae bacterium]|nr:MFS transporter [Steroidobacteraceae bacterium]
MSSPSAYAPSLAHRRIRVRWNIFALLFGIGVLFYVQQRSLAVASYRMMPELGLSQMQIGWLEWAFILGYTLLQCPGGVLGQRLGARLSVTLITLLALIAMMATPLAPLALTGTTLLAGLLALQALLGSAQSPIFPISAGVFEVWFPAQQWPLVQGLQSMGLGFGAALTPPLIAWLMSSFGWQRALVWSSLPAVGLIALWAWYGRNRPAEHAGVGARELAELGPQANARVDATISWQRIWALLTNRDILVLTFSYMCMNYVFYLLGNWVFLYLAQERHFTVMQSGWLAGIPPLAAAVGAGAGGAGASLLCKRYGVRWGLHVIPLASLPAAALLLCAGAYASNGYLAVAALSFCYGFVELNEGSYWAAAMHVARSDTMAATGIVNTGGNVGGLIATPVVAYLSGHQAWTLAFVLGAGFAVAAGAAWLLVDTTRHADREAPG